MHKSAKNLKLVTQATPLSKINVIVDVLGDESKTLEKQLAAVIGAEESKYAIKAMQKAIVTHSVRTKNLFKMQSTWTRTD